MPRVQIKDVPERTHAVLRRRAAAAGQSLQEYLRSRLIQEASEPTLEEVLDRAGGRSGGRVPTGGARASRASGPRCKIETLRSLTWWAKRRVCSCRA